MEYIYGAMLLHKAGKQVNEANIKRVMEAAGIHADDGKVRALIAALDGVNIDEVVKQASLPVAGGTATEKKEAKKEDKKEEVKEEDAAAGLGALFG